MHVNTQILTWLLCLLEIKGNGRLVFALWTSVYILCLLITLTSLLCTFSPSNSWMLSYFCLTCVYSLYPVIKCYLMLYRHLSISTSTLSFLSSSHHNTLLFFLSVHHHTSLPHVIYDWYGSPFSYCFSSDIPSISLPFTSK